MMMEWVMFAFDRSVEIVFALALLGFLLDRLTWARKRRQEADAVQAQVILAGNDKVPRGMSTRMTSLLLGWGFMTLAVSFGTAACYLFGADMWKALGVICSVMGIAATIIAIAAFCDA